MFRLRNFNNTTLGAAITLARVALILAFTTALGFSTIASAQSGGEPQVKPLSSGPVAKVQPGQCTGNNSIRYFFLYTNGQIDSGLSNSQEINQTNLNCVTFQDGDTDLDAEFLHLSCSEDYTADPTLPGNGLTVEHWAIYRPDTKGGVCGDIPFPGRLIISKVTDPSGAPDTFDFSGSGGIGNFSLQDGDSEEFFVDPDTYTVEESPLSGWTLTNIECVDEGTADSSVDVPNATASPTLSRDETVTCTFTNTEIQTNPAVSIEKATNGQDADTATGPYIPVGNAVDWTYVVTNTGDVSLTGISVTDDQGVAVSCPNTSLAMGASMTCTASGTATAGQYANVGRVDATGDGQSVSDTDPSHYFGSDPAIHLEKSTNGQDADSAPGPYVPVGNAVNWAYVVSNTGNVALSSVSVSDNQLGAITCPQDTLAVGESMTCTASGTASAGQYANTGTASGTGSGGRSVNDTDPSHYFGAAPGIDIEKSTNGQDADSAPGPYVPVGNAVNWAYVVTNTGNVALSSVSVSDNQLGAITCPQDTLAVGESMTCTASGTAVEGQYANVGTASGTGSGGGSVSDTDPSHYFGSSAAIDIEKATNGQDADTATGPFIPVGNAVTWTYVVTNTGNVALSGVSVSDDQLGAITCPQDTLAVGESMTCTASGTASAGQYANVGTANGTGQDSSSVSDSDPSHYFGAAPGIDIQKSTNGSDADSPTGPFILVGDAVNWAYVVTNTGNVALSGVSVSDDQLGAITCPQDTLGVGESMTCTASGTASAGQYANVGTASGTGSGGGSVSDTDPSHYFGAAPSIDIAKNAEGADSQSVNPGGDVTWTITVTNTGNVELQNVTVSDALGPDCDNAIGTLAPGASTNYTCSLTGVTSGFTNIANVTGDPSIGGSPVTDSDPSSVTLTGPSIDIEKSTNGQDADTAPGPTINVGNAVNWAYVVTNTGDVTLTGISVTDDQGVTVSCPSSTLAAGASMTCTASGTATAGQYANVGTATGQPSGGGDSVSDTDPSHYFGRTYDLSIIKSDGGRQFVPEGGVVVYTLSYQNTGNTDLTGVVITETVPTNTTFSAGDSTAGWSCADGAAAGTSCTFNVGAVPAGGSGQVLFGLTVDELVSPDPETGQCPSPLPQFQVDNTASIVDDGEHGPDSNPENNQDSDNTPILIECTPEQRTPSIAIVKNPPTQLVQKNDDANFTITVTNNGDVDLVNVTVSDPLSHNCDRNIGDLAQGASVSYSCSRPSVQDPFRNVATACGDGEQGGNVCDDDDAVVRVLTEEEPPQSIPIPTLSEWALILMAGLMLLLGGRRVKEWTRR